jgi:3-phytase
MHPALEAARVSSPCMFMLPPPAHSIDPPAIVTPSRETTPVNSLDDAADDPAVWVHPTDPSRSLILGTDKKAGLGVYDLSGNRVDFLAEGRLNNVDLRDGFVLHGGRSVAIAAATRRDDSTVVFFSIESVSGTSDSPAGGKVTRLPGGVATGLGDVYGTALYHSRVTGTFYLFACDKSGAARQWSLSAADDGTVSSKVVREFHIGGVAEGMVADDEQGVLFVSEEGSALWKYVAEPTPEGEDETPRVAIDLPRPRGHFTSDAEGLALLKTGPLSGYLVLSSQGDNTYNIYQREEPHAFVRSFMIGPAVGGLNIDGVSETDGIEISTSPLGSEFPGGVFVAQDGENDGEPQNFKLVDLRRIIELVDR